MGSDTIKSPLYEIARCLHFRGSDCMQVYGDAFQSVPIIIDGRISGVSRTRGSTVHCTYQYCSRYTSLYSSSQTALRCIHIDM